MPKNTPRSPVKPLQLDPETLAVLARNELEKEALKPHYWHGQAMPTQEQVEATQEKEQCCHKTFLLGQRYNGCPYEKSS